MDTRNMSQSTALHGAVETGQYETVEYLVLEAKASLNSKNCYGHTPIEIAQLNRRIKIADFLKTIRN